VAGASSGVKPGTTAIRGHKKAGRNGPALENKSPFAGAADY
jgi:hypothetical protein